MGRQAQDSVHVRTRPEINNFFYPCQLPIRTRLPEVGLCMVFNRILNFHVVRSTRPCQFTPASSQSIRDRGALCSSALTGLIRARDGRGVYSEAPCPVIWLHVPQVVLHRQEGIPQSSGPGPRAASSRRLMVWSAQSPRAPRCCLASYRQDYPDPRYYLSFTQATVFVSVVRVPPCPSIGAG